MAIVTDPYTFAGGTTAVASQVNARIAAILAQLNGNVDATNLASGGVSKSRLATDALNAFLKLNTVADKKVAWGLASMAWTTTFGQVTVTHGLGATPSLVLALQSEDSSSVFFGQHLIGVSGVTSTQFLLKAELRDASSPVGAGAVTPVYWLAIA